MEVILKIELKNKKGELQEFNVQFKWGILNDRVIEIMKNNIKNAIVNYCKKGKEYENR